MTTWTLRWRQFLGQGWGKLLDLHSAIICWVSFHWWIEKTKKCQTNPSKHNSGLSKVSGKNGYCRCFFLTSGLGSCLGTIRLARVTTSYTSVPHSLRFIFKRENQWCHGLYPQFVGPMFSPNDVPQNVPNIWVWVKIRYPNNWMLNTKLDWHSHLWSPKLGLPFWPTSICTQHFNSSTISMAIPGT